MNLTKKRVEALLELAGRGEDELVANWQDNGIDITVEDDSLIREDIEDNDYQWQADDVWDAVRTYRRGQEARHIMRSRYL